MKLMTTLHTVERLRALFGDRLAISEPLARHTAARVGGPAELFLSVSSADELLAAPTPPAYPTSFWAAAPTSSSPMPASAA